MCFTVKHGRVLRCRPGQVAVSGKGRCCLGHQADIADFQLLGHVIVGAGQGNIEFFALAQVRALIAMYQAEGVPGLCVSNSGSIARL